MLLVRDASEKRVTQGDGWWRNTGGTQGRGTQGTRNTGDGSVCFSEFEMTLSDLFMRHMRNTS